MIYDAILIGAGPIGIEMASVFKRAGISYLHLEAGALGETITRWPRDTQFFSSPEWIAIAGVPIQTRGQEIVTGEQYLAYLRQVVEIFDLDIRTYERVTAIAGSVGDFRVTTRDLAGAEQRYASRTVVLATGDMNSPRSIGVPGEELPHV
ncbi:MAG TPA: NAD(P)-binding domain-containing protein, partial [Spirochaetia bacterium]|nr:NAD(P)-binding domain-containing protein [Spirochaetia bacterium]